MELTRFDGPSRIFSDIHVLFRSQRSVLVLLLHLLLSAPPHVSSLWRSCLITFFSFFCSSSSIRCVCFAFCSFLLQSVSSLWLTSQLISKHEKDRSLQVFDLMFLFFQELRLPEALCKVWWQEPDVLWEWKGVKIFTWFHNTMHVGP